MENKTAFVLGLFGGLLMIAAGAVGGVGFWALLPVLIARLPLPAEFLLLMSWVLVVMGFIAGLGGFAVIIGSCLFLTKRVGLGKFIVGLATGMGFFGLMLLLAGQFISGAWTVMWPFAILQMPGFLGVILSILARMAARSGSG